MEAMNEQIKKALVSANVEGSKMECTFRTATGELIASSVTIRQMHSMNSQVTRNVKNIVISRARSRASSLINHLLGGGILGSAASSVVRNVTNPSYHDWTYSEEEKQAAIEEAYARVKAQVEQGERQGVASAPVVAPAAVPAVQAENIPEFERQLQKSPLSNRFEKEILARMLVEVAQADGEIDRGEREWLDALISPEIGTVQQLILRDPVSPVECRELSPAAREMIFKSAWVLSLKDFHLNLVEESILMEYADMFGLNEATASRLIREARMYVLETSAPPDISRRELFDLADSLGLGHEDAELCLIQMKKNM